MNVPKINKRQQQLFVKLKVVANRSYLLQEGSNGLKWIYVKQYCDEDKCTRFRNCNKIKFSLSLSFYFSLKNISSV